MSIARLFVAPIFAVLIASVGIACNDQGSSDVGQTEEGTLRLGSVEAVDTVSRAVAPNNRPLVLNSFRGTVNLTGGGGETAKISFIRRGRGEDVEAARSVLGDISLTEEGTSDAYTFTLDADGDAYAAVDIRGTVPRSTDLRIERLSGPVRIEGVEGALVIQHDDGPVNVRGAAGPVEVDIDNGDVRADFQTVPAEETVSLRTTNGDVQVGLPPDGSVRLDARTSVGSIQTQGLTLTDEQFTPLSAGARYSASMGEGGTTVELRTENGIIMIQTADTTRRDTTRPRPSPDMVPVPPSDTMVTQPAPDTTDTAATDPSPTPDTVISDTTEPANN